MAPKWEKSKDCHQNIITSVDGHDTSACQIAGCPKYLKNHIWCYHKPQSENGPMKKIAKNRKLQFWPNPKIVLKNHHATYVLKLADYRYMLQPVYPTSTLLLAGGIMNDTFSTNYGKLDPQVARWLGGVVNRLSMQICIKYNHVHKSDIKHWNTLGCLDHYMFRRFRLRYSWDHEVV